MALMDTNFKVQCEGKDGASWPNLFTAGKKKDMDG